MNRKSYIDEEKHQLTKATIRRDLMAGSRALFRMWVFITAIFFPVCLLITVAFCHTFYSLLLVARIFIILFLIAIYAIFLYFLWMIWGFFQQIRRLNAIDDSMISVTVDTVAGKDLEERVRYYAGRTHYEEIRHIHFTAHKSVCTSNKTWYELLDAGETCYVVTILPDEKTTLLFYPTDFYCYRDFSFDL